MILFGSTRSSATASVKTKKMDFWRLENKNETRFAPYVGGKYFERNAVSLKQFPAMHKLSQVDACERNY